MYFLIHFIFIIIKRWIVSVSGPWATYFTGTVPFNFIPTTTLAVDDITCNSEINQLRPTGVKLPKVTKLVKRQGWNSNQVSLSLNSQLDLSTKMPQRIQSTLTC